MNKRSIFFIVVLLAISIPLGLWFWKRQKAKATDAKVDAILPPITPPVGEQTPIDTETGLGALIIQKRIEQMQDSGATEILADSFGYWKKVYSGVKAADFFALNSKGELPTILTDKQNSVLIDGGKMKPNKLSGNWERVETARAWFAKFQSAFFVSLIKDNMYDEKKPKSIP